MPVFVLTAGFVKTLNYYQNKAAQITPNKTAVVWTGLRGP